MTTTVSNPEGARGFDLSGSSAAKLRGTVPLGTEVTPTGRRQGSYIEVQNGGWFRDADGRYENSTVYLLAGDLATVTDDPPQPEPDPEAPLVVITKVEGSVNGEPFVWQP